jgi:hypothetical protein
MFPNYSSRFDSSEKHKYNTFQWLGVFGGAVFPVIVYLLMTWYYVGWGNLPYKFFGFLAIGLVCISLIVGFGANNPKLFLVQAAFCIIFLHLLVLYSGGFTSSVFTSYYLYIPSVIGYVYQAKYEMKLAIAALSISALFNYYYPFDQKETIQSMFLQLDFKFQTPVMKQDVTPHPFMFLIVFYTQLYATFKLAKKYRPQ